MRNRREKCDYAATILEFADIGIFSEIERQRCFSSSLDRKNGVAFFHLLAE